MRTSAVAHIGWRVHSTGLLSTLPVTVSWHGGSSLLLLVPGTTPYHAAFPPSYHAFQEGL